MIKRLACACAFAGLLAAPAAIDGQSTDVPTLLPWSQQMEVREGWLKKRHEMLLPMMRRHNVGMWVVVNEEFHDDPLTEFVAPATPYVGRRDVFVFIDAGAEGLKKLALSGYDEEQIK